MLKPFAVLPFLAVFSLSTQAATTPGNAAAGKKVHEANCTSCHDDSVYKRKDHKVKTLAGLTEQIRSCEHMTDITPEKSRVSDLVKYLNETYYKFK